MQEVLTFLPERQCSQCERMTTTGIVSSSLSANFVPLCPWHGLVEVSRTHPGARERQAEKASIARFVAAIHQGLGRVCVIREVSPSFVPGWTPARKCDLIRHHFPDRAWYVELVRHNRRRSGWVLWSYVRLCFSWVRERPGREK